MEFNNILFNHFPNFETIYKTIEKKPEINKKLISKYLQYIYLDNEIIEKQNKIKEIEYKDENIFLYYSVKESKFKIEILNNKDKNNLKSITFNWEFDLRNKNNNKIEIEKYNIKEDKKSVNNKIIINEKTTSKTIIIKSFTKVEEINLELFDFKQMNLYNFVNDV